MSSSMASPCILYGAMFIEYLSEIDVWNSTVHLDSGTNTHEAIYGKGGKARELNFCFQSVACSAFLQD